MLTERKRRYEALELIGSGTTSRVEMARDNVIGRTVALKTFIHGLDEDLEEQFLHEARLVGQLSHPAIVQLYDVGIDEQGTPFLVMEYFAGKTLEQRLAPFSLTVQRACVWAADLARALALAHRAGIIHGDIKPGNIFITQDDKVKLGDFGIARLASQACDSNRLKGTPAYLAPEQIQGASQDERSDQFSFGIVFYQLLTGVRPFNGTSIGSVCAEILYTEPPPPSKRNPAVTRELDRVVARCLAKNPLERFASFDEVVRSLYPFTRSRPRLPASPGGKNSWWMRPAGHFDVFKALSVCLLLGALVQLAGFLHKRYSIPLAPPRSYYRPGVPYEAYRYARQPVAAAERAEVSADTFKQTGKKETPQHTIRVGKVALAAMNPPRNPQSSSSKKSANVVHVSQLPTPDK